MRVNIALFLSVVFLLACETESQSNSPITCAAGTMLNDQKSACLPVLGDGLVLTSEGTIEAVVDPAAETSETAEAAYARGLVDGESRVDVRTCGEGTISDEMGRCLPSGAYRMQVFAEGAASITPLNCLEGTEVNETGDGCVPTAEYRAQVFAEGAASVVPLNCAVGTITNELGDACIPNLTDDVEVDAENGTVRPTAEVLATAREAGEASITPLKCATGTVTNEAVDACIPNLTSDVEVNAEDGTVVPTAAVLASAREAGRLAGEASVTPLNCAAGTVTNEAGDACIPNLTSDVEVNAEDGTVVPTAAVLASAREAGRLAGEASVTPLNCAAGTVTNEAGDACIPNLDVSVVVSDDGVVRASAAALDAARAEGQASVTGRDFCGFMTQWNDDEGLCLGSAFSPEAEGEHAKFNCAGYNFWYLQEACSSGVFRGCDWSNPSRECFEAQGADGIDGRQCGEVHFMRAPTPDIDEFMLEQLARFETASHYNENTQKCYPYWKVTQDIGNGFNYNKTINCDRPFCKAICNGFGYSCTVNTTGNVEAVDMVCSGFENYACTLNADARVDIIESAGSGAGRQTLNYTSQQTDRSAVGNSVQQNYVGD